MTNYYEKANPEIIEESKQFIEENKETTGDYFAFRKALSLYIQLSESLIESHKAFDEAIQADIDKYISKGDIGGYLLENVLNSKQYKLYLDVEAHVVLNELYKIQHNNDNNYNKKG